MAKGHKTGGRTKGTPNRTTAELKDMVLEALHRVGGVEYLENRAHDSPVAFLSLLAKILPYQMTGKDGGPIETKDVSAIDRLSSLIAGISSRSGEEESPSRLN